MLRGLVSVAPHDLPRLDEVHLDVAVLSLTTLFCCACAFVFGVAPAVKAAGVGGQELVTRGARGSIRSLSSLRRPLMVAEIAVAMVLLSGAGLMVNTMVRLSRVDPGFDPHDLQTFMFSLTGAGGEWPDARKATFYQAVVERLRDVPGVQNAAITYSLPILGSNWWNAFMIAGRSAPAGASMGDLPNAGMMPVTAAYFETLEIPVLRGRSFEPSDTHDSPPVAIVNDALARRYWSDEDPIGEQIRQGFPSDPYGPWRTIVGVVGDVKQHGVDQEVPGQIFMPLVQQPRTTVFAVVRTRGPLPSSSIEAALHELDGSVPIFNDRTVEQVMSDASSRRRIAMLVLSVFGGVAVLLAAIGLYGVIAQEVAQRRQEVGVRMALGAGPGQVVRFFLRRGLIVVVAGIGCGLVAVVASARTLASLVFGITVTDPATFGAVAALLTVVALVACYMPLRSATRADPLDALRLE